MHETKTTLDDRTYINASHFGDGGYANIKIMGGEVNIHTSHFYVCFSIADWKRLAKEVKQLIKTHEKENDNG